MAMTMTEDQRRRMELLNGIDPGNIRALDALAHASFPAAETAPTTQRGAAAGDRLMSAEVRAPASLRPSGGNRTYGGALPKVGYQEIKETTPGGGTKTSSSYSYSSGGVTEPWTGSMPTVDPFSYGPAPTYGGSPYDNRRDQLLDRLEREQFSYDPATDPVWQSYQKQYRREGQRAAEDALGRAAASTGGVASSYAAQAASQAGNYYAAQLSDRLPQVYQDAYNRYLKEYERQLGLADTFNGLGQQEYNRYRDTLGQYNTDRNFAYGVYSDEANRAMDQYTTKYNEYLNEMNRRAGERDWKYGVAQDEKEWARKDMLDQLDMAELGAKYGDYSGLQGFGIDTSNLGGIIYAYASDGSTYNIGSAKGQYFIANAAPGQTMQGGDGSIWTKNPDGGVTITKGGKTYVIAGAELGATPAAVDLGGGRNPIAAPEAAGPELKPKSEQEPEDDRFEYDKTPWPNGTKRTKGAADLQARIAYEYALGAMDERGVKDVVLNAAIKGQIADYEIPLLLAIIGVRLQGEPEMNPNVEGSIRQYTK